MPNWRKRLNSYGGTAYRSRAGYRGFGAPLLSVAWAAAPSSFTPFPYVVRYYFLLSNLAYKGYDNVYSPNYAVAYPSLVSPTTRGYVGRIFDYGGGVGSGSSAQDYYPSYFFLIEDPDTPTQPWSTDFFTANGNGYEDSFNTARAWNPDQLHWIATGFNVNGTGGTATVVPYVVIFGRGRDHNAYLRWSGG